MDTPRNLLVVDDDYGLFLLLEAVIGELHLIHRCHYVEDGLRALQFLQKLPPYEHVTRPDVILLDLNLPGQHGSEVLKQIKQDPDLRTIPVIMISTCRDEAEIRSCYSNYANAYIAKGSNLNEAMEMISAIDRFWMKTVTPAR